MIVAIKHSSQMINKMRNLLSIRLADSFSLFSILGSSEKVSSIYTGYGRFDVQVYPKDALSF